ncbi:hypothetical protein RJT34_02666 [Clitoria ternatea]|uniref:Uncharacterized protein n=1 Tax=Clitoria ternatea TaxID=43366 RepID=A0AAN9KJC8_CLITE
MEVISKITKGIKNAHATNIPVQVNQNWRLSSRNSQALALRRRGPPNAIGASIADNSNHLHVVGRKLLNWRKPFSYGSKSTKKNTLEVVQGETRVVQREI